jgi:hypothetical protein
VIVYFGQLLENHRSIPHICATSFHGKVEAQIVTKKWVGLHFGRFFSQTHLAALLSMHTVHATISSAFHSLRCVPLLDADFRPLAQTKTIGFSFVWRILLEFLFNT